MFQILGPVNRPQALQNFGDVSEGGIGKFLNLTFRTLIVVAGIYALFNLVTAGFSFMAAGDDPKKVAGAWQRIWQTLIGLSFAAGAFVLAAVFGQLLFGDPTFILNPSIPTP
jgi:hypothetical protein